MYLALDLGTSGCRAAAFASDGRRLAHYRAPYPTRTPRPGWAEQDPAEWEASAVTALGRVVSGLESGGGGTGDVASITLTGQMAGLVFVDAQGGHPYPALPWNDRRAEPAVTSLIEAFGPQYYQRTGCHASSVYPVVKLLWLAKAGGEGWGPLRRERVRWVLSPKDELARRLSGSVATDPSTAVATGLWNLQRATWDPELCQMAGIHRDQLPPVRPASSVVGGLRQDLARDLGLPSGLPIVLGAGDGVCQNLGVNVVQPGDAVISLGSSGVIRGVTAEPLLDLAHAPSPRLTAYPFVGDAWITNGATANAAGVFDWLATLLNTARLPLETMAAVPAGAEGLLFLPYLVGERSPLWEPTARGVYYGLTASSSRGHLVRAAVEGVAMAMRRLLEALREQGWTPHQGALAGGAGTDPRVARIVAEVLGIPLLRYPDPGLETLRGAAILGLAAEEDRLESDQLRRVAERINPPEAERFEPEEPGLYDQVYDRFLELTEAFLPYFRKWA